MLLNLLSNAVKYTPAAGRIHVDAAVEEPARRHAVIRVRDTGPGIAPDEQEAIFQPYYQTQDATSGFGLGLAISRELMREMGGELEVESDVGQGSTFILRLERAERPD